METGTSITFSFKCVPSAAAKFRFRVSVNNALRLIKLVCRWRGRLIEQWDDAWMDALLCNLEAKLPRPFDSREHFQ